MQRYATLLYKRGLTVDPKMKPILPPAGDIYYTLVSVLPY